MIVRTASQSLIPPIAPCSAMLEALRQLQHDKSKSVAKVAEDTFKMLQRVNAHPAPAATESLPHSLTTSGSFMSPPWHTPSPQISHELSLWPSEPPRACTEVDRRTSFQEALCLFSEVAGLSDDAVDLPAPPALLLAPAAAASGSLPSFLRQPRPRVSPPETLSRPSQFLPAQSSAAASPQIVVRGVQPTSVFEVPIQTECAHLEAAVAAAQPNVMSQASFIAAAVESSAFSVAALENAVADVESFNLLSRIPSSPVFTAANSAPRDELPPIPLHWRRHTHDSPSAGLEDNGAALGLLHLTDAEVGDVLGQGVGDTFLSPVAPTHVQDEDHVTAPLASHAMSDCNATSILSSAQRSAAHSRVCLVGVALGGAVAFAAASFIWRAWQASDFEHIM